MKRRLEKSELLDGGGKPTVRELLASLVFNPVDRTIRLSGERIVMQRATVGTDLRRELIHLLGAQEARQPYPNPAAGEVFVPFHIGENKGEVNIAIQVYDGLGRYVDTIVSDKFSPGDHQAVWNSEGRSGLFVVNMQSGDGQVSRTKVVVK
jgi:hypothetical protein